MESRIKELIKETGRNALSASILAEEFDLNFKTAFLLIAHG